MAKKKITQLDLFSGIGGFHLGFKKAGYKVKSYFSEIDKHAIAVYKHQFKDAEYVGSVTDIRGEQLPKIDLITFGSPCQDFSLAGKRKGMGGERSSLVLEAIRLIDECRPSVFVWENVKGTFSSNNGADFAAILQAFANIGGYRLEWQLLNTSWVLPQNRERVYLVGYSTKPGRNWRGVFPIEAPGREPNKGLSKIASSLQHPGNSGGNYRGMNMVVEADYAYKNLNKTIEQNPNAFKKGEVKALDCYNKNVRDEVPCLTSPEHNTTRIYDGRNQAVLQPAATDIRGNEQIATIRSGGRGSLTAKHSWDIIKVKSATKQGYEVAQEGDSINLSNPNSETRRGRVGKGKAQTLDTGANQGVVQPVAMKWERTEEGKRKRKENRDKEGKDYTSFQDRKLTPSDKPISNTITSFVEKDAMIHDTYRIRRLTPIECERLQGFPDNHTAYGIYDGEVKKVSNTQRYKQCGNAVTVDIVALVAEAVKPLIK